MPDPRESLASDIVSCEMEKLCYHSPRNSSFPRCHRCCLSDAFTCGSSYLSHWSPITPGTQHPRLIARKLSFTKARCTALLAKRLGVDKDKRRVQRSAKQAERATERDIIKATKNSGRSLQDGDHILNKRVVLDTKEQSTTLNLVVHADELAKVRRDAQRNGYPFGGLVLRNVVGQAVVVMTLGDFAELMRQEDVCLNENKSHPQSQ